MSHWSLHSLADRSASTLSSHPKIHFPHSTQSDLLKMQIQSHFSTQNPKVLKIGTRVFAMVYTALHDLRSHVCFMSYLPSLHSQCSSHIVLISVPNPLLFTLSCIHSKKCLSTRNPRKCWGYTSEQNITLSDLLKLMFQSTNNKEDENVKCI